MKLKFLTIVMLMLSACEKNNFSEGSNSGNREMVEVTLNLSAESMQPATEEARQSETRVGGDEDAISSDIKNLWVIQIENDKVINAVYYSDFSNSITLATTTGASKIIYIANTFESYIGVKIGDTTASVQGLSKEVASGPNCLTQDGEDNSYYILNGEQNIDEAIIASTELSCSLKRNVAKISIKVTNNCDSKDFTINSVQLHLVPAKLNYCTYQLDEGSTYPSYDKFNYTLDYPAQDCGELKKKTLSKDIWCIVIV